MKRDIFRDLLPALFLLISLELFGREELDDTRPLFRNAPFHVQKVATVAPEGRELENSERVLVCAYNDDRADIILPPMHQFSGHTSDQTCGIRTLEEQNRNLGQS